ncbi:hypothetical protein LTS08_003374 [Lithohypha guttulata]|uniref:Het-C-domain-containing protein n=1 Tax=Lithohypha guttulata TaxID=1690604 RepID=A0AAN7SYV9_9EURO|nr:hypothetical protein LTR05_004446 [Lithohypha guttulata]KAK5103950.1 hypothetical protein LTS08_003374 [Lithohypha guttulata]
MALSSRYALLILLIALVLFSTHAHAFGAGNIASISNIEGKNWRHGDIEDLLKQVTCIKHHKWTSMMIKRAYFGNWLRDYSQAMDTGALKKAQPESIRILVWLLSFLGFGYATAEFEVTSERLGVYRPEEHIDNPKNYNDDQDARPYDARLRAPVRPIEIQIDHETGMKNYIANGKGDWATSAAFVKYSFTQSIHHGRLYTSGSGMFSKGKDEDLAEALRLLGQGLHTLEDYGAHTNYVELALIELGHRNVFPHVGANTQVNVRGKRVWPLVTGTFGMVDFYHSVIGEAKDHFTQSEVSEMNNAMGMAEQAASSSNPLATLVKLLSKVPGAGSLGDEATRLHAASTAEARRQRQGGSRRGIDDFGSSGVDHDSSSSRGLDDYSSSRAGPGDFPGAGHYGAASHSAYNSYSQPLQQNYYQSGYNDYDQGYGQQPPPQWNQPPPMANPYNQGPMSWQPPPQPPQHDPYMQAQSWTQPAPQHDQYNGGSSWQQSSNPSYPPQQSQPQILQAASSQQIQRPPPGLPGMPDFDPGKTMKQIYPILVFRDKVVRTISSIIEKIPGLEALVDRIVETLTVFIFSLLAPFVRPVLNALQKTLQSSSEGVTEWNKKHQYEVWDDPNCSDPTHSMLSKDHFSNILNEPAGRVAGEILKFIAPRVLYAWEHPEVPVDRVMQDVESIFHHPALRDERSNECHRNMFNVVKEWTSRRDRNKIDGVLNAQAVRKGDNHIAGVDDHAGHGSSMGAHGASFGQTSGHTGGHANAAPGGYGAYLQQAEHVVSGFTGGGNQHSSGGSGHASSNQGGLGGILSQAESFLGGSSNKPGSHGSSAGAGGFLQQAESFLGGSSSRPSGHHGGSSGGYGGGGLNDMLGMASKLPGVGNYASSLNQFNKLSSAFGGLGGKRDLPGEELDEQGRVRGPAHPTPIPGDDGDYGDSDRYVNLGLSSVGGANEFYESALRSRHAAPSPGSLPVPSGYETYSQGGSYEASSYGHGQLSQYDTTSYGGEGQSYAQQSRREHNYQSGGYGGGAGGYSAEQTGGYGSQRFDGRGAGDEYYRG